MVDLHAGAREGCLNAHVALGGVSNGLVEIK